MTNRANDIADTITAMNKDEVAYGRDPERSYRRLELAVELWMELLKGSLLEAQQPAGKRTT